MLIILQIFFVTGVFFKTGEYLTDMLSMLGRIQSRVAFRIIMVHTSESSRNIRNKTFSVRLESCGHLIKSIKLKKRPFP